MSKIYDKTAANFKATTVDAKIIDAQKILVRPKGGAIDERVNILDAVGGLDLIGDEKTFNTNETTYTGETEGVSIQLDKTDFIPSNVYLKEVSLPYIQGLNTEARYCHVLFFNGGQQIAKITSLDTQTRQTGNNTLLKSTWTYKNVLIPEYQFVRIVLSSSATLPVTGSDSNNCSVFRINVCRNQNNQNINPTNLSKLYNSNGSTQSYKGWVEVKYAEQFFDKFVTDEELSGYATSESLSNYVSKEEFEELLETNSQKQQYYDTWTNLKDGDIVDKAGVYSFQLDKNDFTTGRIDRIEIPYIAGTNVTGYLCVQFFNSSNSAIATYYSINKQKQDKTGEHTRGICEYEFSTFETPANYSYVRFSMVANTGTVPTGNSGISFRIMPIKRNNTFTWNTNTNTKVNNTGNRWTILLSVLTRNYAKNTGITVRNYDWTPDVFCPINVTLSTAGTAFVAPTNGWIISKSAQTTSGANSLTLNGIEIGKSSNTSQADVQILMRQGEFITATTAYNLIFYPCKSEQFDYRINSNNCDIWKGAVVYDEYGQPSVKDLYIPDASAWKSEVGHTVTGKIATIANEEALDADGNVLFNIQSQYIENGKGLLVQSTITTWSASLAKLKIGEQMFGYSSLTNWTVDMPLLWKGDTMFYNCKSLTSFRGSLQSLTSGWNMFCGCSTLTDVNITSLSSLNDGTAMFGGCALSYQSLLNILNVLPTVTTERYIEITISDSAVEDLITDERFADVIEIPAWGNSPYTFNHKGWQIALTSQSGVIINNNDDQSTAYDIVDGSNYIPDASNWNQASGIVVTSVHDGYAWKDN